MLWLFTRSERPVDIPISMSIGYVRTRKFKINLDTSYVIDIEVESPPARQAHRNPGFF